MQQISIIVPIYNVANYLPRCLDSIVAQLQDNWELILVNDGSKDDSLSICEKFAKSRKNVKIIDKENGGLSDARNAGTRIAQGEYIYYLDSDDWIAPDAIKKLYDFAIENHCEVVQGGFYYAYEHYLLYDDRWLGDSDKPFVLERYEAMHQLILNNYVKNFAWGKLYKAKVVKEHLFPKGKYFEDSYWQHLVMHEITRYGIVPTPLYYYYQRDNGISGEFSTRNLDLLKGYKERIAFIDKHYPQFSSEINKIYRKLCIIFNESAISSGDKQVSKAYSDYLVTEGMKYNHVIYKISYFYKRVRNHFFGKRLKRIEL